MDVRFPVVDPLDAARRFGLTSGEVATAAVAIWTTTPWTLPANQAVCLHPLYDYVIAEFERAGGTERLVVAEALLESFRSVLDRRHIVCSARPKARRSRDCDSSTHSTNVRCPWFSAST